MAPILGFIWFPRYSQGHLQDAAALYREVLEGRRAALGPQHPETLTSINNLASALHAQGHLEEANQLFQEALQGCRTLGTKLTLNPKP